MMQKLNGRFALAVVLSLVSMLTFGQMVTTSTAPYNSTQHLIENVLVGPGVTTFNWTYVGAPAQVGFFSNGFTSIGIDSGIVMSSGNIANIPGNVAGIISTPYNGPGDADLFQVATSIIPGIQQIRDRAIIEFDFVAPTDTVQFEYVFASEEWPNYIGSTFNDAFGFFVSGPGITGPFSNNAINVAAVPGTTTPITISTIHPGLNSQYYNLNNNVPPFAFFAYTDVFATLPMVVNPCDTFHMKLAIGDGQDAAFDSAVFLKARSFKGKNIVLTAAPTYTNFGNDSTLYETCGGAQLTFERLTNISGSDTINFQITGTATNGVDYTLLPDSIVFTPGQTTASIGFNVFADTLVEGLETLIITVLPDSSTILCNNDTTELVLYLADVPTLGFQLTDDTIINCTDPPVSLVIDSLMGLLPATYLWSTSDTDSVVTVLPSNTTTYYVTVSDACAADTLVDSVTITVITPPFITATNTDTINCTDTATISVEIALNYLPGIQFLWSTGESDSIIRVAPDTTTSYLVSVTLPCSGQLVVDTVTVVVDNPPFITNPVNNFDTINCTSDSVDIGVEILANWLPGITFDWGNSTDSILKVWAPVTSQYTVTTTLGCSGQIQVDTLTLVIDNAPISVNAPDIPATSINCPGDPVNIYALAGGGYPAYTYLWSTGSQSTTTAVAPMTTSTYYVSVTDTCGLDTIVADVVVNIPVYPPLQIIGLEDDTLNCPEAFTAFGLPSMSGLGGIGYGYLFSWDNWASTYPILTVQPSAPTSYTVEMTDFCHQDTASFTVTAHIASHPPLELFISDSLNLCVGEQALIGANSIEGGGDYQYIWSNYETADSIVVSPNQTTIYSVTVTDDCDTSRVDQVVVTVKMPEALFSHDFIDAVSVQFTDLSSSDVTKWYWDFGSNEYSNDQNPLHLYQVSDVYFAYLIVENDLGCTDSVSSILTPPLVFWVPKAFSPNNDTHNDVFEVKGLGVDQFFMDVFDRWGNVVYSTNIPNFQWDGTKNGEPLPVGVYVYKIYATGFNNEKIERTGTITIVR